MKCVVFNVEKGIAQIEDRKDLKRIGPPGPRLSSELRNSASFSVHDLVKYFGDDAAYEAFLHHLFCEYRARFETSSEVAPRTQQRAVELLSVALRGLL